MITRLGIRNQGIMWPMILHDLNKDWGQESPSTMRVWAAQIRLSFLCSIGDQVKQIQDAYAKAGKPLPSEAD